MRLKDLKRIFILIFESKNTMNVTQFGCSQFETF